MLENTSIGDGLRPENRREIEAHFRRVCNLGANVIVGWRSLGKRLQVFYVPSYSLPMIAKSRGDMLHLNRHVADDEAAERLTKAGCRETTVALKFNVGMNPAHIDDVNEVLRYYSVTHFDSRAVALFDMVSFSIHSPHEQITHVNVLSYYIKLAAARCRALGMAIDVCMTTTGDGFYVWNRRQGLDADIVLFCTVVLALGYTYAARKLTETSAASVPRLRCAIHFGSHYEYYQGGLAAAEAGGYIVGDVTISLARLLSKARTGQFLVGSTYIRLGPEDSEWQEMIGGDEIDSLMFMAMAQEQVAKFKGSPIPGGTIKQAKVYFTGPRVSEDTFSIRKYYVPDKHGFEHPCFNAKLDLALGTDDMVSFGLVDDDLAKFDVRHDADEDILIKIR